MSRVRGVLVLGAASAAGLALGASAAAQTKLRMANWLPPVHHVQETLPLRAAEIAKAAGGAVGIDLMKASLAPAPGQYDLVRNEAEDLAYGVAGFGPNRFALFRALEVPLLFRSAEAASVLFDESADVGSKFLDGGIDASLSCLRVSLANQRPTKIQTTGGFESSRILLATRFARFRMKR